MYCYNIILPQVIVYLNSYEYGGHERSFYHFILHQKTLHSRILSKATSKFTASNPTKSSQAFLSGKKKVSFFFFLLKKPILYIFEILLPVYTDSNSLLKDIFWAKTGIYKITIPTALDPGNQRPYALPQKVTRMVTWESGTVQACPFI